MIGIRTEGSRTSRPEPDTKKLKLGKVSVIVKSYGKQAATWIGKSVILFVDENVTFGSKVTGGIRVRIPRARRPVAAGTGAGGTGVHRRGRAV